MHWSLNFIKRYSIYHNNNSTDRINARLIIGLIYKQNGPERLDCIRSSASWRNGIPKMDYGVLEVVKNYTLLRYYLIAIKFLRLII